MRRWPSYLMRLMPLAARNEPAPVRFLRLMVGGPDLISGSRQRAMALPKLRKAPWATNLLTSVTKG